MIKQYSDDITSDHTTILLLVDIGINFHMILGYALGERQIANGHSGQVEILPKS